MKRIIGDFVSKRDDVRKIWKIVEKYNSKYGKPSVDFQTFFLSAAFLVKQRLSTSPAASEDEAATSMEGSDTVLRMAKHARDAYSAELPEDADNLFATAFDIVEDDKELILRIRGTDSLADIVTDLAVATHETENGYVHLGVWEATQTILDRAMPKLEELGVKKGGKSVCVVGHSLGGACAGILGPLLQSKGIECKAYAFAPAACVSESLTGNEHVTTYVIGADCVPRLTWKGIENLSNDLSQIDWDSELEALAESTDKWLIGGQAVEDLCREQVARIKSQLEVDKDASSEDDDPPSLFPPGIVYHITDNGIEKRESDYWQRIELSPRLMEDHLADSYVKRLEELQ